jgi:chemotaxis methyl-accepting protein methylase
MQLLTSGSEDLIRKFSKIIAKDFDPHVIDMAKSGVLPIQAYEVEKIQKFTNGRFRKFFPTAPKPIQFIGKQNIDIQFDKELNKKIDYSVADITTDFKTIEPEGSMVFARNFLPYLRTRKTVVELVKNLGEHLKKGSNLAVGNFDHRGLSIHRINLNELLEVAGFNKTKIENLYEKV